MINSHFVVVIVAAAAAVIIVIIFMAIIFWIQYFFIDIFKKIAWDIAVFFIHV